MVLKMLLQMVLKRLRLPRRARKEAADEERKAVGGRTDHEQLLRGQQVYKHASVERAENC